MIDQNLEALSVAPLVDVRGPSDRALIRLATRFALALRLGSVLACLVAGPLAATDGQVDHAVLTAVLSGLTVWAALFAAWTVRHGLSSPLVLADVAVVVAVLLVHGKIVPSAEVAAGTTWVLMLASTAVFIAQLMLRPAMSLPAAVVVASAYVAGVPVPTGAPYLLIQAGVTCTLMTLLRSGGRDADTLVANDIRARRQARAEEAARADEREQHRRLHDTLLSTLTVVALGSFDRPSATLAAKASDDLTILSQLAAAPDDLNDLDDRVSLDDLLQDLARRSSCSVHLTGTAPDVARHVAEGLRDCVSEALRNVAQHSGVDEAVVCVTAIDGGVSIEIVDLGHGFDPLLISEAKRGIRESLQARVASVGGSVTIASRPGAGTRVQLRWPSE
jgi:signal transduction histidine kinase